MLIWQKMMINEMIIVSNTHHSRWMKWYFGHSDHLNWMITLTVSTLCCVHCIFNQVVEKFILQKWYFESELNFLCFGNLELFQNYVCSCRRFLHLYCWKCRYRFRPKFWILLIAYFDHPQHFAKKFWQNEKMKKTRCYNCNI